MPSLTWVTDGEARDVRNVKWRGWPGGLDRCEWGLLLEEAIQESCSSIGSPSFIFCFALGPSQGTLVIWHTRNITKGRDESAISVVTLLWINALGRGFVQPLSRTSSAEREE